MVKARESSSGEMKPVYAIYGPDEFLRRQAIEGVIHEVLGDEPPPMALIEVEGPKVALAEVLDELRTLPFLSDRRLVVVREADAFISAHREALERYVASPCSTGVLVLISDVMNKQWRVTRAIQQIGRLIECKAPPPWERTQWLMGRASQAYGKRLEPIAAQALVDLVGGEMAGLDAELVKLTLYVGDRELITTQDVEDLVGYTRPENVFRMTDALAQKDAATCLRLWRQTLATDDQAAYKAIGGLAWAVRQMMAAKEPGRTGTHASMTRSAAAFSLRQLQDILMRLLAADVGSKTGLGTVDSAIEKLVVEQCMAR